MKQKQPPINIYQNRRGITFLDGFFLARNPKTQKIIVISISRGIVYIHDVFRQTTLQNLINMDAAGQLDIFDSLKLMQSEKNKNKKQKNDD